MIFEAKALHSSVVAMLFSLSALAASGPVNGGTGYVIDHGDSAVIDKHGVKKKVKNNHASGRAIFVPLKSSTEWSTFIAKPPAGVTIEDALTCPTGYILVPGNPTFGTSDFCVAKYEMKNVGGVATSQASGKPWVNINRNDARAKCQSLGTGYKLISNAQWQTIARNIEQVAANWQNGSVGSGALNRGHSTVSPSDSLAASSNDNDACSGTGQSCTGSTWNSLKRTHKLSNGEVIWDFSGNVSEWVNDDYSSLGVNPAFDSGKWIEFTSSSVGTNNRKLFGPSNSSWSSTQAVGKVYGGSAGGIYRGGAWNSITANIGIFTTYLINKAAFLNAYIGFRCVYDP